LANGPAIDILRPRSVAQILGAALSLYRRYPVLFLVLAFVVTAPYELIVLAALGTAPIGGRSSNASTALILVLVDVALVGRRSEPLEATNGMRNPSDWNFTPSASVWYTSWK